MNRTSFSPQHHTPEHCYWCIYSTSPTPPWFVLPMWTFPVQQERREMAAMQLGKGAFFNAVHPGFFALSLVSLCTTVLVKMSLLKHYCLIYKLILLSSESDNRETGTCHRSALWNISETSIYSNTRCIDNDSLLPHYSCLFLKSIFAPFPFVLYMQTCFFSASKSAFYLRTSQFLWLHCTTSTNAWW